MDDREKVVVFEKLANFRQAGGCGIHNKHGQAIRDGLLYRCSQPDWVTARDALLFQQLGIKTIFDLRHPSDHLRSRGARRLDETYQLCKLQGDTAVGLNGRPLQSMGYLGRHYILSLLTMESSRQLAQLSCSNWFVRNIVFPCTLFCLYLWDRIFKTGYSRRFYGRYVIGHISLTQLYLVILETSKPVIVGLLRQLLLPVNRPSAICCNIGKDRTGVVVAVILGCLDVAEEVIIDDYSKSEVILHPKSTMPCIRGYIFLITSYSF